MPQITCSRCGSAAESLDKAPLPGAIGDLLLAQTCPACWKEWLAEQVRLINEYRLSPVNPEHFDFLIKEMKRNLKLQEQ